MFRSILIRRAERTPASRRAEGAPAYNAGREVRNRVYCTLCTMLLAAGNARAEDDVVDIDPNFTIFGVFRDLWDFLTGLIA